MWGFALIFFSGFCINSSALSFSENDCKSFWARQTSSPVDQKLLAGALAQLKRYSWLDIAKLSEPEAFVALSFTPSGRALLEKFLPLYQEGKVVVRSLHGSESAELGLDPSTSAGGYSDGVLYMDEKSSILEYLTVFAHEATHAVEWLGTEQGVKESQWLKKKNWGADELDRAHALLIRSEHRAFRAQDRFQFELAKHEPDFEGALSLLIQQKKAFPFPMSQSFFSAMMVSGYSVPPAAVESYFLKHSY